MSFPFFFPQQKDALLEEIQVAKELLSSKEKTFERFAAMEMCHKYQDKQAVDSPTTAASWLARAVCVCLRKKNADMAEVNVISPPQPPPVLFKYVTGETCSLICIPRGWCYGLCFLSCWHGRSYCSCS